MKKKQISGNFSDKIRVPYTTLSISHLKNSISVFLWNHLNFFPFSLPLPWVSFCLDHKTNGPPQFAFLSFSLSINNFAFETNTKSANMCISEEKQIRNSNTTNNFLSSFSRLQNSIFFYFLNFQMIEINDTCAEDPPQADAFRMILIVGIGTVVCSIGIVLNSFLLLSFRRLDVFRSNLLYLFLLACLDILVELCFMVSLFSSSAYFLRLKQFN